jgi:hypothetical protein
LSFSYEMVNNSWLNQFPKYFGRQVIWNSTKSPNSIHRKICVRLLFVWNEYKAVATYCISIKSVILVQFMYVLKIIWKKYIVKNMCLLMIVSICFENCAKITVFQANATVFKYWHYNIVTTRQSIFWQPDQYYMYFEKSPFSCICPYTFFFSNNILWRQYHIYYFFFYKVFKNQSINN